VKRILEVRVEYRDRATDQMRVAYFYCKRGQELYALIPREQRSTPAVQRAEGLALNLLAALLHTSGWQTDSVEKSWEWHCRSEDFPGANPNATKGMSRYDRGPYAAAAWTYYKRAAALLPEEPDIRCSGARVARAMKNEAPMQALRDSVDARASLGSQWLDLGFRKRDATYLKLALDEYGEAIARNPYHVDSLNQFAYAAYLWRLFNVNGDHVEATIDPAILAKAEKHARLAVALTARGHDPRKRIMVRSTLGEILLAQNRSHEAVEELSSALSDLEKAQAGAEHAAFDELRWDLRQAALCAALADERSGFAAHARQLRDTADGMIKRIKESDRQRESQRFGDISRATSALEAPGFCKDDGATDTDGDVTPPPFVLARVKYGNASQRMCARHWVRGSLQRKPDAQDQDLSLEVRGGGSGVSMTFLPEGVTEPKAFTDNLRASHQYYFAQLMEGGEPRSAIYALQTYAPASGDCSRNLLTLEFEPSGAAREKKQKPPATRVHRMDLGAVR
jgi:tetratricopeptide (TPR) repeat protein